MSEAITRIFLVTYGLKFLNLQCIIRLIGILAILNRVIENRIYKKLRFITYLDEVS